MLSGAFVEEFIESVRNANRFYLKRKLRIYQRSILSEGVFELISPTTGRKMDVEGSYCLKDGSIAYLFEQDQPIFVIAQYMRFGYPICTVATKPSELVITRAIAQEYSPRPPDTKLLEMLFSQRNLFAKTATPKKMVVLGHKNFAHHLWNELGGLETWGNEAAHAELSATALCPLNEPLGPVEEIFPELVSCMITRGLSLGDINNGPGIATRVGSMEIPVTVRSKVLASMTAKASDGAKAIPTELSGRSPVIWISLRPPTSSRACLNQDDFLTQLSMEFLEAFPNAALLFDGFSLPLDFTSGKYNALEELYSDRAQRTHTIVQSLIMRIVARTSCSYEEKMLNLSGMTLADSIMLGSQANYYVCHSGTLQHKIGWLHNIPGCIHSCKADVSESARGWYAKQVEGGIVPSVLPPSFVEDVGQPQEKYVADRNVSYRINDVALASEYIIRRAREAIPA